MAYKIPALPGAKAYIEEKADFWEVQTLRNNGNPLSQLIIAKVISKGLDEINVEGVLDEDDELDDNLDDVFKELIRRSRNCVEGYPFSFGTYSIRYDPKVDDYKRNVYIFLLLCTRFRMDLPKNKVQNGIDGTLLFEHLCSEIAKNYFGHNSNSWVFGTATKGNFEKKIKILISKLGEGGGFKNPNKNYPTKNDDGIDVVVWKNFTDNEPGKLIGFGQCKTGTSWRNEIHKLRPIDFCDNWLMDKPLFPPFALIFLTDTLNREFNFASDQRNKLIFNRFRIMEYLPNTIDREILEKLKQWNVGALKQLDVIHNR